MCNIKPQQRGAKHCHGLQKRHRNWRSQTLSSAKGTRLYRKNYSKYFLAGEEEKWAFSSVVTAEQQREESQVNSALNFKVTEAKEIMDPLLIFSSTASALWGCGRRDVLIDSQVTHTSTGGREWHENKLLIAVPFLLRIMQCSWAN